MIPGEFFPCRAKGPSAEGELTISVPVNALTKLVRCVVCSREVPVWKTSAQKWGVHLVPLTDRPGAMAFFVCPDEFTTDTVSGEELARVVEAARARCVQMNQEGGAK